MTLPATIVTRPRGMPLPARQLAAYLNWWRTRAYRAALRTAPLIPVVAVGRFAFPGVLAGTDLYEAQDVVGRPWAFLHNPVDGQGSLVLDCAVPGVNLADRTTVDPWVTSLALWLTTLTSEPDLAACALITERRPRDPRPAGSVCSSDEASTAAHVRIQLTFAVSGMQGLRDPSAVAVELAARIPRLIASISRHGIGTATPVTASAISATLAKAFGPDVSVAPSMPRRRRGSRNRPSSDAVARQEWGRLVHGKSASITWLTDPVGSPDDLAGVLGELLQAAAAVPRVRVTLTYEDATPARDTRPPDWTGLSLHALGVPLPPTADDRVPPGVAVLMTATAATGRLKASADEVMARLPPESRPGLRQLYGSQAAGFAAALPTGTVLTRQAGPPALITSPMPKETA